MEARVDQSRFAMDRRTFLRLMGVTGGAAALGSLAWRQAAPVAGQSSGDVIGDLAASLDYDVERMFDAVAAMGYDPYPGALRGGLGTLEAGRGNSVDQALLLGALLDAALIEYRYVLGSVSADTAARQIASRPHALAPARDDLARVVLPPEVVQAWGDSRAWPRDADIDRVFAEAEDWVVSTVEMLATTLSSAGIPLASPSTAAVSDDRDEHVWIQHRLGSEWVDLDPSVPGAVAGTSYGTPRETLDQLPDALYHMVTVRLAAEVVQGGVPTRTVPVTQAARVADLIGTPIYVTHGPAGWLDIAGALTGEQKYIPLIVMGQRIAEGEMLMLSSGGGVLDAFGDDPGDAEGQTLAEWLEVDLDIPGQPKSTSQRLLFDRIPPERRASGELGLDALPAVTLTHIDDEIGDVFVPFASTHLIAATSHASPWTLFESGTVDQSLEGSGVQGSLAFDHLRDLLELQLQESLGAASWVDRPLVTWLGLTPTRGPDDTSVVQTRVDMLDHRRRADVLETGSPERAGILAGVIDHAAERMLIAASTGYLAPGTVTSDVSVARVFEQASAEGLTPVVLMPGDTVAIDGLPSGAGPLIDTALREGLAVVIPPRAVDLDGRARIGWWEYDPATGHTRDRLDDGGSVELTETQILIIRIATAAACGFAVLGSIAFVCKAAQGKLNNFTDFTDALSSAGGAIAGCAAGGFALP
jgi:transglutaminase-like putative cysteine protease